MYSSNLQEYIHRVAELSERLGIPSIREEDGLVLQAVAYTYAAHSNSDILVLDLGAGIGYSTLWLIAGLEPVCVRKGLGCRVVAVEYSPTLSRYAREILGQAPVENIQVTVIEDEALHYLREINDCSVDIAFVDIDKESYTQALQLLSARLRKGGIALFHNAFIPRPPTSFFEAASRSPWISAIIPTSLGILEAIKTSREC